MAEKTWKIGSVCMVLSKTDNKWYAGKIENIIDEPINEWSMQWFIIRYKNNTKTKKIKSDSKYIKPIPSTHPLSLKIGSKCKIRSDKTLHWCNGEIINIYIDSEGEWLKVKYTEGNEVMVCDIQRYSSDIKPIIASDIFYHNAINPKIKKTTFILDRYLVFGYIRKVSYTDRIYAYIPIDIILHIIKFLGHLLTNCNKITIRMHHDLIWDNILNLYVQSLNDYLEIQTDNIPTSNVLQFVWPSQLPPVHKLKFNFNASYLDVTYIRNSITFSAVTDRNRSVGRWYLGSTIGKGKLGLVKKGYDKINGNIVALKFIFKSAGGWNVSKKRAVQNEMTLLSQIRHQHVVQLLECNLHTQYPQTDGSNTSAALLVLEYLPGGELFDLVYYTGMLSEVVSRTYFQHLMDVINELHEAGICHRDIKPQNLLLDANFQLKIIDFDNAHVFENHEDYVMTSYYVGTRGYQAPEILKKTPYKMACDVFSCGVVLFVLLSGYPPFETASSRCRWYSPLINENARKFWTQHKGCGISGLARDLITRMLWYNEKKRLRIAGVKKHKWYNEGILNPKELTKEVHILHSRMKTKRNNDVEYQNNIQYSMERR